MENPRKNLAKKAYLDPQSSTFGNKTASLRKAGYSASYAETLGGRVLADIELTEKDIANFKEFIEEVPNVVAVMKKKRKQLEKSKTVSARDYANFLRQVELTARLAGMFKEVIEKREVKVVITAPKDIIDLEYLHLELKYYKNRLAQLEGKSVAVIGEEYQRREEK